MRFSTVTIFVIISLMFSATIFGTKDCRIDEREPWTDPDNVYECNDTQKCCIEATKPSCCTDKDLTVEILDQVKLWGGLIGAITLIGILVCLYRSERGCCCCCGEDGSCCKKKPNDKVQLLQSPQQKIDFMEHKKPIV